MLRRGLSQTAKIASTSPPLTPLLGGQELGGQELGASGSTCERPQNLSRVASDRSWCTHDDAHLLRPVPTAEQREGPPMSAVASSSNDEEPRRPWTQRFSMPNFSHHLQRRSRMTSPAPGVAGPSRLRETARWVKEAANALPPIDDSSVDPAVIGVAVSTDATERRYGSSDSSWLDAAEQEVQPSEETTELPQNEVGVTAHTGRCESKTTLYSTSCISDEPVSKRSNKIWRAWIRTTNTFRETPVPVESRVSKERLLLD